METWVLVIGIAGGSSMPLTTVPGYQTQDQCTAAGRGINLRDKMANQRAVTWCIPGPRASPGEREPTKG